MATKTKTTRSTALTKKAAQPAAKKKASTKKSQGIVATAKEVVSDVIANVAKPASAGLKAGASTFIHEVANTISGTATKKATTSKKTSPTPARAKTLAAKASKAAPAAKASTKAKPGKKK